MNKTTVKVIFPAPEPGRPTWPYIDYDVAGRSKQVIATLQKSLPQIEFSADIYTDAEQASKALKSEQGKFDGYLVYLTSMWTGVQEYVAENFHPVIIADELYSGSGGLLKVNSLIQEKNLPVVTIASSDFQDIIDAVRLFDVMNKMRHSTIAVVADGDTWGARKEIIKKTNEIFGTQVVRIDSEKIKTLYEQVDSSEANSWKDKWIKDAQKVVEPDEDEILKSARMYLALRAAMQETHADAITVDCLGLYYANRLVAYPCLGFFQLNNDGQIGVCEADIDSTLTQMLMQYLTGRPGYVSDPVIDTATDQIIYAHCVATNKVFGPDGMANPYIIRSHAEDRKGASVQSLLPVGRIVSTAKVCTVSKSFIVHSALTVANIDDDRGCRTKLAAEVDTERVLENYNYSKGHWHRVTVYGDCRRDLVNLARLYGLDIIEEDR